MIKSGQKVRLRRVGTEVWLPATVDLASTNQRSLAVSADEGLGSPRGFLLDRQTGRMVLCLFKETSAELYYRDIYTLTEWEVQNAQDQ